MTDVEYQTAEGPFRSARRVYFHVPDAPMAAVVTPSVFVAVRDPGGRLLLVRRWDSRTWELPGGRVDVGESAVMAAERETEEESGLRVRIVGLVGLYTDPAYVIEAAKDGQVRQPFQVCFHAIALRGSPRPDMHETVDAAWFDPAAVAALPVQPGALTLIGRALSGASEPYLG
jgi:8-oxo-dGTP pyrophosphatase MutT (NUDIX family)